MSDLPAHLHDQQQAWLDATAPVIAASCTWTSYRFVEENRVRLVKSDGNRKIKSENVPIQRTIEVRQGGIASIFIDGPNGRSHANQSTGKESMEIVSMWDSLLVSGSEKDILDLLNPTVSVETVFIDDIPSLAMGDERSEWIKSERTKLANEFTWEEHHVDPQTNEVISSGVKNVPCTGHPFLSIPATRRIVVRGGKIQEMYLGSKREDWFNLLCDQIRKNDLSRAEIHFSFADAKEVALLRDAMQEAAVVKDLTASISNDDLDSSHLKDFVTSLPAHVGCTLHIKASYDMDRDHYKDYVDQILGSVASQPQVAALELENLPFSDSVLAELLSTTRSITTLKFTHFNCYDYEFGFASLFEAMNENCSVKSLTLQPDDFEESYQLTEEDLTALETMLRVNEHLQVLVMNDVIEVGPEEAAESIARGLQANESLKEFHLGSEYCEFGLKPFADALRSNTSLASLHFNRYDWADECTIESQVAVLRSLDQNLSLTEFLYDGTKEFIAKIKRICLRNRLIKWMNSQNCNLVPLAAWPEIMERMFPKAKDGGTLVWLAMKKHLLSSIASEFEGSQNRAGKQKPSVPDDRQRREDWD